MYQPQLSKSDSRILAQVFDPESGPAKPEVIVDPALPADRYISGTSTLTQLRSREKEAIRLIEEYEKSASNDQRERHAVYCKALSILDQIAEEHPVYASVLNNRAQLRRWYWGDRNLLCQHQKPVESERVAAAKETVRDLRYSVHLTSPPKATDAVSPSQGRLLAQAYTQLGAVFYAAAKDMEATVDRNGAPTVVVESHADWTKDGFEEEASRLFFLGGLYGNEVAKALAVHTNPQAKLCGSIVKEAMRKELALAS